MTRYPLALAALAVLRGDFPDFYEDLEREPDLIRAFNEVFRQGAVLDEQPDRTRTLLTKYGDNKSPGGLRSDLRPLRQFIASLDGLPWPPTLRPLLFLAEDPTARRLGERSRRLEDAFVSGDELEVLAQLARDRDSRPLAAEDVYALRDLLETLEDDTPVRRNNAGSVVAALANRLPGEHARLLLAPLARQLSLAPALRWRVGLDKVGQVIRAVQPDERQALAARLVEDLLQPEGDIGFRLEGGGTPSLDEALNLAREAAELVLWVRQADGLAPSVDEQLLRWLESRRVAVGGQEQVLPMQQLEIWAAEGEPGLILALGPRYPSLLADHIQVSDEKGLVVEDVVRRSLLVFDQLWSAGEEQREALWPLLTRFSGLRPEKIVAISLETMRAHADGPTAAAFGSFVKTLAQRLTRNMDEPSDWGMENWRGMAQGLLELFERRPADVGRDGLAALTELTNAWSADEATAALAVRLVEILRTVSDPTAHQVAAQWGPRVLTDLEEPCLDWLARNFPWLDSTEQEQVAAALNTVYTRDDIPVSEAAHYRKFIAGLSAESFEQTPLATHMQNMLPQVTARYTNPNQYLNRVFPALPPVLRYLPKATAGNMLHALLAQARGSNPSLYGWLHAQMAGYWPHSDPALAPYNPDEVFQNAAATLAANPASELSLALLASMRDMVQREVVSATRAPEVVDAACVLWPTYPDQVLEVLTAFELAPTTARTAGLAIELNSGDDEAVPRLQRAWGHIATCLSDAELLAVTRELLSVPPNGPAEEPDRALRVWLECQPKRRPADLSTLLSDDTLNDDQRHRVWLQADRVLADLGPAWIVPAVRDLLVEPGLTATATAVLDAQDRISAQFGTDSARLDLGGALLAVFVEAPTVEIKNRTVDWLQQLHVPSELSGLADVDTLTEEDLDLLDRRFPRAKALREWRDRHGAPPV